ncbi:SigE family RNA polymerase sigma factor [Streptomyces sp. NPDC050617]|uniref:RNA polymerase sigma factor n=1 Tax=Streptomyces sp. NPDC050617 TaxID=3154628 RepID=UPI00341904BF
MMSADFDELFVTRFAAVVRALAVLGADRATAEDLAQEAFLVALCDWGKVGRLDSPEAWVAKTAVNKWRQTCRTAARRQDVTRRAGPFAAGPFNGAYERKPAEEVERRSDVMNGLLGLPERQREVLVLHYFLDQTVAEVAQLLGIAPGTVKSTLHDARSALGKFLEASYADDFRKGGSIDD